MRDDTFLLRHVKLGRFFQEGFVTSEVFIPNKKTDGGMLSVYDGEYFTAEEAVEHQRNVEGGTTLGVVGILPGECCNVMGFDLPIKHSPKPDFERHMEIDFTVLGSRTKQEKAGQMLRDRARKYGFLWRER